MNNENFAGIMGTVKQAEVTSGVTIVGRNEAGFSFTFAKDAESTIEPQFKAHPLDKDGTLLIFDEDIVTEV